MSSSCHAALTDLPNSFCHLSLSSIASGRSSRQYPLSVKSCGRYFLAG